MERQERYNLTLTFKLRPLTLKILRLIQFSIQLLDVMTLFAMQALHMQLNVMKQPQ